MQWNLLKPLQIKKPPDKPAWSGMSIYQFHKKCERYELERIKESPIYDYSCVRNTPIGIEATLRRKHQDGESFLDNSRIALEHNSFYDHCDMIAEQMNLDLDELMDLKDRAGEHCRVLMEMRGIRYFEFDYFSFATLSEIIECLFLINMNCGKEIASSREFRSEQEELLNILKDMSRGSWRDIKLNIEKFSLCSTVAYSFLSWLNGRPHALTILRELNKRCFNKNRKDQNTVDQIRKRLNRELLEDIKSAKNAHHVNCSIATSEEELLNLQMKIKRSSDLNFERILNGIESPFSYTEMVIANEILKVKIRDSKDVDFIEFMKIEWRPGEPKTLLIILERIVSERDRDIDKFTISMFTPSRYTNHDPGGKASEDEINHNFLKSRTYFVELNSFKSSQGFSSRDLGNDRGGEFLISTDRDSLLESKIEKRQLEKMITAAEPFGQKKMPKSKSEGEEQIFSYKNRRGRDGSPQFEYTSPNFKEEEVYTKDTADSPQGLSEASITEERLANLSSRIREL